MEKLLNKPQIEKILKDISIVKQDIKIAKSKKLLNPDFEYDFVGECKKLITLINKYNIKFQDKKIKTNEKELSLP